MFSSAQNKIYGADDAMAQIGRLRQEVEMLMRESVTPAVASAVGQMASSTQDAIRSVQDRSDVLAGRVRHRPLASIVIAAAVGYLVGRLAH